MAPRRKSRIERLFSLNQHFRRRGAKKHLSGSIDLNFMKTSVIDLGRPELTRGSSKKLDEHLDNLRREFSGQPELLWHHAKLIVLVRREYRTKQTYNQFRSLWDLEGAFLAQSLNLRWLIAAADTFADHEQDSSERAVAMMASLLGNAIKMQESERYICGLGHLVPDAERITQLQDKLIPLFSGTSCFTVGTDDTLRNLRWRLQPFFEVETTGPILQRVWNLSQIEDTVFARMRKLHRRKRTSWWDDVL